MARTWHHSPKFLVEDDMQQSRGCLGFSKHRQCRFHRVGTAPHVLLILAREFNREMENRKKVRPVMYESVREAFEAERAKIGKR